MGELSNIGVVVIGATSVLGLFGIFIKLIVSPINELTVSVAKLNAVLEKVSAENTNIVKTMASQSERIGKLEIRLARNNIA